MNIQKQRTNRQRSIFRQPALLLIGLAILLTITTLGAIAQGTQIQANPTEEPQRVPDNLQANPTPSPTPRSPAIPANLQPNPTEAPQRVPDGLQANPTRTPTPQLPESIPTDPTEEPQRVPDSLQANPTRTPTPQLPESIPPDPTGSSTLTVHKWICPPLYDPVAGSPKDDCAEPHNGVTFDLNHAVPGEPGHQAVSGETIDGAAVFEVEAGTYVITEQIPDGYGTPFSLGCAEVPDAIDSVAAADVEPQVWLGNFYRLAIDANTDYECHWMNVPVDTGIEGPGSVANPGGDGLADLRVTKRTCPNDIPPGQGPAYYIERCTEIVDGIDFTVNHGNGNSTKPIASGEATWTGLPLGPFTIQEEIPVQYGEPIVFCGWTAIHEGVVYDAFSQILPSEGGLVEGETVIPNTFYFCYWFNVEGGPGSFSDPGASLSTLLVRKWACPEGTLSGQDQDYYTRECDLLLEPVEFTLDNADGSSTESTSSGFAEWTGLPLGEFTLEEEIPDGYGPPVVFCGWYAYYGGFVYDAFPQLVVLGANFVIEGEITIPNTDYFCDVFNIKGGIDDIHANPTAPPAIDDVEANPVASTVRVVKRDCPPGVAQDASLSEYLTLCAQPHDGVEFTLETSAGIRPGTTAGGGVEWTGVPSGAFKIQDTIPVGYGDPIVFCGYTESPGGGVQHPAIQTAAGGLVTGEFPDTTFEFVCYWMNIKSTGQVGTGPGSVANPSGSGESGLVVSKRVCPDIPLDQELTYYLDHCTEFANGIQFTLTNDEGSSTKPVSGGTAEWTGLPLGPWTLEESIPVQYGAPIVFCGWTAFHDGIIYDAFAQLAPSPGGVVEGEITIPNTSAFCFWINVQAGPGSVVAPQDTTNTIVARKWNCPGDIKRDQVMGYYFRLCEQASSPVELTLTNDDGVSAKDTSGGYAEWNGVPLGPFTLQETIPAGYGEPIVFCGGTAFYMGAVYDDFHKIVPSTDGLVEGQLTIPNTHHLCHFMNIPVEIDDLKPNPTEGAIDDVQANPTEAPDEEIDDIKPNPVGNTVTVIKKRCPLGVVNSSIHADYVAACAGDHDDVEFQLTSAVGGGTQSTVNGQATWDNLPLGDFEIQEVIPPGFQNPKVFCGFSVSGSVVQTPTLMNSVGGLLESAIQLEGSQFVCHWLNIPSEPVANLGIEKSCPTIPPGAGIGDEITYEVAITNTGDVTLYDIDVIETREGTFDAPFPTELAPGESATRTFTSEITAEDVAHGNVDNGVAVTASGDVGGSTTDLVVERNVACRLQAGGGGPGDLQANPTSVPTEEIDDL